MNPFKTLMQDHGYQLGELFGPKPYVAKVYEDFSRSSGG